MKLLVMPREITWWIWLVTVLLLAAGLAGISAGFAAAILLSAAQTTFFALKHRSLASFPVQVRLAYTLCLLLYAVPGFHWMFWLPAVGTSALVLFGYCLMARILSLMPWNRTEPMTMGSLGRTFLTPPVLGNVRHGLPSGGCPGGVCELERYAAQLSAK